MDRLLTQVLDAHGGLDRWSRAATLTAHLSLGGPFWAGRGWPAIYTDTTVEIETQREHAVFTPFTAPDRRSVLDVAPERIALETRAGQVVEHRRDPRRSFPPFTVTTPWDALQVAYFTSYAVWNYLTAPFLFTYPGVEAHEIAPWDEDGQTWRRLHVTFPPTIVTHNPVQIVYYDAEYMQRRLDYEPDVTGALIAHYTAEPRTFDGLIFPTRRRVYRRNPDGTADHRLAVITIAIATITIGRP